MTIGDGPDSLSYNALLPKKKQKSIVIGILKDKVNEKFKEREEISYEAYRRWKYYRKYSYSDYISEIRRSEHQYGRGP